MTTPWDAEQRAAVDRLLASGRLSPAPIDPDRATTFLRKARHRLEEVEHLRWPEGRYTYAYDAAHDVGEALLAAHGLRTANGAGQHEALGRFLRAVLTTPPGRSGARRFDQIRRARNQQRYDGRTVGDADAAVAVRTARDLYEGALDRGLSP